MSRHERMLREPGTWAHIAVASLVGNRIPYCREQRVDRPSRPPQRDDALVHAGDRFRDRHRGPRGKTALAAGRHSDAFFHLLHVFDPHDSAYMPYVRPWGLADIVDAAVHAGFHDDARAIVATLEPIARRSRSPQLNVALDFAHALLAHDDAAEAFHQAGLSGDLAT